MQHSKCIGHGNGSTLPMANKILVCRSFTCLPAERATRQCRPLLQLKTQRLMLPARRWKRLLQLYKCKGHGNGSTLPTANRIPVCRSLIVYKRRARRGNVAFFCNTFHVAIDASSSSLKAIIATLLPTDGIAKKAIFRWQSSS